LHVHFYTIFAEFVVGGANATLHRRDVMARKTRAVVVIDAFTGRLEGLIDRVKSETLGIEKDLVVRK
jgi:hypothetical protein